MGKQRADGDGRVEAIAITADQANPSPGAAHPLADGWARDALIEASDEFMALADLQGNFAFLNRAGRRLVGLDDGEDCSAFALADLVAPDWRLGLLDEALPAVRDTGAWSGGMPLRHRPTGARVELAGHFRLVRDPLTGAARGLACVARAAGGPRRADDALQASEARLRTEVAQADALYREAPLGLAVLDHDLHYVRINEALAEMNGKPVATHLASTLWAMVPDLKAAAEPAIRRVLDEGETLTDVAVSGTTARQPGVLRHWLACFYPVRRADGQVTHLGMLVQEITERKQAESRQQTLMRELDHRAKNLMGIMTSLVRRSRGGTVEEFAAAIEGRIAALARAHDLLTETRWQGVGLRRLVERELQAYGGADRSVSIAGPDLVLQPVAGQGLALAVHELATNAAKYGALSVRDGEVGVAWAAGEAGLTLEWRESGGPPVRPPEQTGFGTKVIRIGVEDQLGGTVAFAWRPGGLVCRMTIPAGLLAPAAAVLAASPDSVGRPPPTDTKLLSGRRVLVAEDEAMLASEVAEALAAKGCVVVGPTRSLEDSLAAAERDAIDVAVLDANLAGRDSKPVAEALARRGVPFVLASGYQDRDIEAVFGAVPRLAKPYSLELLLQAIVGLLQRPG